MQVYLVPTSYGIFLHDSSGKILAQSITYPDVKNASTIILKIQKGIAIKELANLLSLVESRDVSEIEVENPNIAQALKQIERVSVRINSKSREIKMFRSMIDDVIVKNGIIENSEKAKQFRRAVALRVSMEIIAQANKAPDLLVKHAIDAIGEIDKNINILAMRLREWTAIFMPSLSRIIEDHEEFVKILRVITNDGTITDTNLLQSGIPEQLANNVIDSLQNDIGAPLNKTDNMPLAQISDSIDILFRTRKTLEDYIEQLMKEIAPNMTALVGPLVGARLISLAGSLVDLAKKTSSTIQVLGAEKALFRSLKTGTAPPKHGAIFQVPELYSAPYWQRGKIARALAGKLSIAAKIDAFSNRDIGQKLRASLEKRIEEIRRHHPEPPPTKPKPEKQRQRKQYGRRGKQHRGKRRPRRR